MRSTNQIGFSKLGDEARALRDERAIAKVRELRANMTAPFFIALGMAYDRGILTEEKVRGNETLEGLRELYLMFEPPGNHP